MKQIEKQETIEFLLSLDERRYIDVIAASGQAHVNPRFYIDCDNNDFVIHLKFHHFNEYYFNIIGEENVKYFCELMKSREKTINNYVMLYSYDKNFYDRFEFIHSFEIFDRHIERKYGLFNKIKHNIILPEHDIIREMTINDINIIKNFAKDNEEYFPSYELLNHIEPLENNSKRHKIWGYFKNNKLTAFVTIHAVNESYWNIGYLFTSPEYRQNGIAANLAKHYINEFIDKDVFVSYGSAQNENSQKTAMAAGFELFTEMYYCCIS